MNLRNVVPFQYVISSGALAAGGSAQVIKTMQADSHFELVAFMASSTADLDSDVMPNNFSVQITDQSTGRMLSDARVPQRILCGPANRTILEKYPVVFAPNTVLLFDFLDLSGAANTVTLSLIGYKRFDLV